MNPAVSMDGRGDPFTNQVMSSLWEQRMLHENEAHFPIPADMLKGSVFTIAAHNEEL